MSERLPYEELLQQKLNDLPLPDEDKAWADMKRRLEEDDDDGIIVWWRRGCMLWGLLLLVLLGSGIWWFTRTKTESTKNTDYTDKTDKRDSTITKTSTKPNTTTEYPSVTNDKTKDKKVNQTPGPVQNEVTVKGKNNNETPVISQNTKTPKTPKTTAITNNSNKRNNNNTNKRTAVAKPVKQTPAKKTDVPVSNVPETETKKDNIVLTDVATPVDTVTTQKTDTAIKKPDVNENKLTKNEAKKDSSKKKQFTFSAGVALQQLLPVAGQKTTPYNSQGRKGTLADYIPSVYFRVNREEKWFIQGEFRYGAPQYAKEFVYSQQRKEDTLGGGQTFSTRTSNTLKKTYYHQLPVTFNYYVMKDWSIGAGLSWNKFVSAISDQEVTRRNNQSAQDSLVSKGIIKSKNDTAFKKSYFQAVFESQYKWKRFSFGARYTFGLEPYVKFTLLNGETGQDRNRSLQIFLRYQLWKSKKKDE